MRGLLALALAGTLAFTALPAPAVASHLRPPDYQSGTLISGRKFFRRCNPNVYLDRAAYDVYPPRIRMADTFIYWYNWLSDKRIVAGRRFERHYKEIYPAFLHVPHLNIFWIDQKRDGTFDVLEGLPGWKQVTVFTDPCKEISDLRWGHGPYRIQEIWH